MEDFVSLITIFIIVLSLFIYYESKYSNVIYIKSDLDNKMYLVRNLPDKQKAANLLSQIKQRLTKLTRYLDSKNSDDPRIKRLVNRYKPDNIRESEPDSKYTSYSVNKGEKIVFCVRSKDKQQNLVDINLLMFVALHELAHVMSASIGHTEEFWDNFRYLLKKAIEINIYRKHDFQKKPRKYCGTKITDSPLK